MPRSQGNVASHRRRKGWLERAKGYFGGRRKLYRTARETVERALRYAFRDRRAKKRQFRRLWITRINAATRMEGLTYSRFIDGLKKKNVTLDRKQLAYLAYTEPKTFSQLVALVKG